MEPDDNFSLINSYSIDESHPRQLPKAVTYNQVNPTPSVPDVSLVFDRKVNDMRHFSNKLVENSHPLHGDGALSPKNEDNGPRKIKPTPIAPLPNETYAAWRARALNTQNCISSRLPESTLKSGALGPCDSDINESLVAVRRVRDTSNSGPNGVVSSHHFPLPSEKNNNRCSNEKTRDVDVRVHEVMEMPHQNEAISEKFRSHKEFNQSKAKTPGPCISLGTNSYGRNFHESPCDRKNQHSTVISGNGKFLPDHLEFIENMNGNGKAPIVNNVKQIEYSHRVVLDHSTEEVVDDLGLHCWGESSVPVKGSAKKRDALRDLYRIIQLQNEQLQSLQAQVEKLVKKNLTESSISAEPAKPKGRSSLVICVEEGTQTSPEPSGVSSVGIMTSFIETNKQSDFARGDFVHDNGSHCKCKGCPGKTSSSDYAADSGAKVSHASGSPLGQKFEAPRPLRNLRKIHQVIEEETESDESTSRLTNDVASQTRSNSHLVGKRDVHPESDVRGCMMNASKQSREHPNEGRSKSRPTSSDGIKLERKGSYPEMVSLGKKNGKKIQDKCGQNCKQLENLKHCPGHTSVNHKTLAAKSRQNDDEMTMTLNGVDLQTVTEPQLSPEPSIHVEIQDYKEFSGEVEGPSDEDSYYSEDEDSCSESGEGEDQESLAHKQTHEKPSENMAGNQEGHDGNARVGWTFYNNVLGQVNKLLENQDPSKLPPDTRKERCHEENLPTRRPEASPIAYPGPESSLPSSGSPFQHPDTNNGKVLPSPTLEVVREATLQHLRQLGIDLSNEQHKNNFFSPVPSNNMPSSGVQDSRRVTFDPQNVRGRQGGERRPTETSLRIKALALKYLSDDQLTSCGYLNPKDSPEPESLQGPAKPSNLTRGVIGEVSSSADFTLYGMNGTNLSFTTLRYLQRYHLLPSNGAGPAGIWRHQEGIQQTNFVESAALARGLDLGNTRSPGRIDYTNDYMDGFHQGADMAVGRNGLGGKVHSSTPANKVDHVLPSPNTVDTGKEVGFLPRRGDFTESARDVNSAGNQIGQSGNKVVPKPRTKGKHRGPHVPKDKGFKTNGNQTPCMPRMGESERPPHCNVLREGDWKQRGHNDSLKSSNILDITALRQQPKLL